MSNQKLASALRLTLGSQHLFVWLTRDPDREERALAWGLGHTLTYDGRLEGPVRKVMLELGRAFGSLAGPVVETATAVDRLCQLCARLAPDARLEPIRTLLPGQVVPKPAAALHQGTPGPGSFLWPFDPELAGLRVGCRRLLKREPATAEELAREREWLAAQGLQVREVENAPGRPPVLLAAEDSGCLHDAVAAERSLGLGGAAAEAATRWIGEALGYPPCCIEAFTGCGNRTDDALAASRLAPALAPASPPETAWLVAPLSLLAHIPCTPRCSASMSIATRVLGFFDSECPGFPERWRELSARIQVVDPSGRWVLLSAGERPLSKPSVVGDAVELVQDVDSDEVLLLRRLPELVGETLQLEAGALLAVRGQSELVACLWSDHRGGAG